MTQTMRAPAASPIDPMRLERDRHVAFAFAAADLLIEADVGNTIIAASGAAQAVLGLARRDLLGKQVEAIVAPGDRRLVGRLLKQIRALGRIDPAAVHMAREGGTAPRTLFGGCQLPNSADSVFLSVTLLPSALTLPDQPRDAVTGLLTADALREAVHRASSEDGSGTRQLKLLRIDGLSGAARQLSPGRAAILMKEIGATLRALSIGGDSAGRLGEDAFGIVTKIGDDLNLDAALVADLSEATRAAGVSDDQIRPQMARIDLSLGGLSDSDAGLALNYAMNSFVQSKGGEFTLGSLQDGLTAAVNETVSETVSLRRDERLQARCPAVGDCVGRNRRELPRPPGRRHRWIPTTDKAPPHSDPNRRTISGYRRRQ